LIGFIFFCSFHNGNYSILKKTETGALDDQCTVTSQKEVGRGRGRDWGNS